jgi:hypothetical protein
MYEMQCHGVVEQALIERAFAYDVMLHTAFAKGCVQPGAGWTADSMTRYPLHADCLPHCVQPGAGTSRV